MISRVRAGLRRRRQSRDFAELDDRLLADVGIARARAIRAASKGLLALINDSEAHQSDFGPALD